MNLSLVLALSLVAEKGLKISLPNLTSERGSQ